MKKSGIYKIVNAVTNKEYVGSSIDILHRWRQHRYDLAKNKHTNQHLQNAWNKYGKETFGFFIIEECEPKKEVLLEREQYYIDTLKPEYNILEKAGSRLGSKQSEETRRKISENQKGKIVSESTKEKISKANTGKVRSDVTKKKISEIVNNRSEETRRKISEGNIGKIVTEETKQKLRKACHENGNIPPSHKGKNRSDEFKIKVSESLKGHSVSEETRIKISEANKGKASPNKRILTGEQTAFILHLRQKGYSLIKIISDFNEQFPIPPISTRIVRNVLKDAT